MVKTLGSKIGGTHGQSAGFPLFLRAGNMSGSGMSAGGGMSLTETVKLVYSIGIRGDRFWLDAVVLVRSARPWPRATTAPPPQPRLPALGPGAGGCVGRHHIFIARTDRVVWINRSFPIRLNEFNLLMLDHADDPVKLPSVHDIFTIHSDLGAAPSDGIAITHAIKDAAQQLRVLLEESVRVRAFLHS